MARPPLSRWSGLLAVALAGCGGPAADDTAAGADAECLDAPAPPRQLRLLTRAEYDQTVRDLFAAQVGADAGSAGSGDTCDTDADCALTSESCSGSVCVADPCTRATFVLSGWGDAGAVVVAGDFNGWAGTAEAGGLAMARVADQDLWYAKADLGEGAFLYKFVVDGSTWLTDPANPDGVDDGYGGRNSRVTLSCDDAGAAGWDWDALDLTAAFPVESRPEGFAFDNHAGAGLVSSTHLDRYLDAAETLADLALADADAFLGCDPDEDACVDGFLATFGARVFRRPLTAAETARYRGLVDAEADREEGLHAAITALFVSPSFLYRSEVGVPLADGARLTAFETASALSYFLWGTAPDAELTGAAEAGELAEADGREAQARRLLADPRARAQVERFTLMWLGVESVGTTARNLTEYPDFDAALGAAMVAETAAFAGYVVFDGEGTIDELYTAPYGFVNADLAALYGVDGVSGDALVRVDLPPERGGLLSQAAILTAYAHSDQTSPVRRGVFVRERLLCQDLPPPPANAASVPTVDGASTTRDRFEQHSSDPACSGCHQYIDPVGFGLENYDAIGAWRELDNGLPVDAGGDLPDAEGLGTGTHAAFSGAPALGALLASSDAARSCLVTQVARFARGVAEEDTCATADLRAAFATAGGSIPELLVAVVRSDAFVTRE